MTIASAQSATQAFMVLLAVAIEVLERNDVAAGAAPVGGAGGVIGLHRRKALSLHAIRSISSCMRH